MITNGSSLGQAIFPVNAKQPEKEDFDIVRKLKEALIGRSRVQPKKLPIKWHVLELVLHRMMQELHRKVLSREECEFVAHKLHFNPESFKAALLYLSQLNIITYYEKLPSVIFGSCQVILDKITEIIHYSLQLKKGTRVATGMDRKLVNQGIVSLALLSSDRFPKHYDNQMFGPQALLMVLEDLLVVGEIGPGEYLMPCVLDLSCIYPSPQVADGFMQDSFILLFPKHCAMLGIFCAACSFLLRDSGWRLLTEGGEVVQVARNSIAFEMPRGCGGQVILKDPLSSYLEVSVELPTHITGQHRATLYNEIRVTLLSAVEGAMKTHNHTVTAPQLSFLCPEKSGKCSLLPHPATIDEAQTSLTCSQAPSRVSHPLTEQHRMWLAHVAGELCPVTQSVGIFLVASSQCLDCVWSCDESVPCSLSSDSTAAGEGGRRRKKQMRDDRDGQYSLQTSPPSSPLPVARPTICECVYMYICLSLCACKYSYYNYVKICINMIVMYVWLHEKHLSMYSLL